MSDNPLAYSPPWQRNNPLAPGAIGTFNPASSIGSTLAPGEENRVSTRIPNAVATLQKTGDPHNSPSLKIDTQAHRDSGPAFAKNALLMRGDHFPDLPVKGMRNPEAITKAAIDHMAGNLVFLHNHMVDKFGQDYVDEAARWYDGAHNIANDRAARYGYLPQQSAAAYANLSPQKDWFQNVSLGDRLHDIVRNKQDQRATNDMVRWAHDYVSRYAADADTDDKRAALADMQMSLASLRRGVSLREINDPDTRAFWARAYDEAHNPREYHIVNPDGSFGELARNDDGTPSKVGWGSFKEIGKAMQALETTGGDIPAISRTLGGNHKVRNFYNNIVSPLSDQGDVTIDTHAIAAAHLRPLAGADFPVKLGLGLTGSASNATGAKGAYGIYADAYREAARRLNLSPRQLQSIAWEGIRGLFSPEFKRNPDRWNENYDLWKQYKDGKATLDDTRKAVLEHAGGVDPAEWWRARLQQYEQGRQEPPIQ